MNYDSEVPHGGIVLCILAIVVILVGGIYFITGHLKDNHKDAKNQCIDAGGTWLLIGGEIKCFSELKVIPLREK